MFSPASHYQRDTKKGGFLFIALEDPYLIQQRQWTQVCSQFVNEGMFSMFDLYQVSILGDHGEHNMINTTLWYHFFL